MQLTPEQSAIQNHVLANEGLTLVSSVAGSGKTSLLVSIAAALQPTTGLYLAYNRAISDEASTKFPHSVSCLTTHSLALRGLLANNYQMKLTDNLSYRNVPNVVSYEERCHIVDVLEHFFMSDFTSFTAFLKTKPLNAKSAKVAHTLIENMANGLVECSHGFYLKLFHILLDRGDLQYPAFDIIMLDEAGDINPVTLAIFNLLPSSRKIMVGDPHQNIYSFNKTVNCFALMENQGTLFPMSQSFRVSSKIASKIQKFCQTYLHEDMEFRGIEVDESDIKSKAYIARTNATLISRMIQLNQAGISYNMTRKPSSLFKLPKTLCSLKHHGFITIPEYTYLQDDVNDYYESSALREQYNSVLGYIKSAHPDDVRLQSALSIIFKFGAREVIACSEIATKHYKDYKRNGIKHNYTVGTGHSTKGLEFDSVELAHDMNEAIAPIIAAMDSGYLTPERLSIESRTELNLYYVACSRARKVLENANFLSEPSTHSGYTFNPVLEQEATNPNQ